MRLKHEYNGMPRASLQCIGQSYKIFYCYVNIKPIRKFLQMDYLRSYNADINSALSPLDQPMIAGLLRLFLVLYGSMVAPSLPDNILKWFGFVPFRIFVLFLIVYIANHQPDIAILVAIGFYVSINVLAGRQAFDKFAPQTQYYY